MQVKFVRTSSVSAAGDVVVGSLSEVVCFSCVALITIATNLEVYNIFALAVYVTLDIPQPSSRSERFASLQIQVANFASGIAAVENATFFPLAASDEGSIGDLT